VLGSRVLVVLVLYFPLVEVEKPFQDVLDAVGFLVGVARESLPLPVEELLCGEVAEDEVAVEDQHDSHEQKGRDAENGQHYAERVLLQSQPQVFLAVDPVVVHYDDAHGEGDDQGHEEGEQEEEELFVVALADAGAQPGTVVVHLLDADSADVAVAGSGRAVDVAGEAELHPADLQGFGNDVADLYVALDVLILGYGEVLAVSLVLFILGGGSGTIF
jgi:hypothetical protein